MIPRLTTAAGGAFPKPETHAGKRIHGGFVTNPSAKAAVALGGGAERKADLRRRPLPATDVAGWDRRLNATVSGEVFYA